MSDTPERALLRRLVAWADSTAGIVAWTPTQALTDIVYPAVIIAEDARALLSAPPASECRWTPGLDDDIWSTACGKLYQVDTPGLCEAAISEIVRCPCGGIILTPAPPASEGVYEVEFDEGGAPIVMLPMVYTRNDHVTVRKIEP